MSDRRLAPIQLDRANLILDSVRRQIEEAGAGDVDLLFALRRKTYQELTHAERGKPMQRRKLKVELRKRRGGPCKHCDEPLPARYVVLDRFVAAKGYVAENVQLICEPCDRVIQLSRKYP